MKGENTKITTDVEGGNIFTLIKLCIIVCDLGVVDIMIKELKLASGLI